MKWKFWKTENNPAEDNPQKSSKLPRPKDLPNRVGIHLVTQLNMDPDWVWSLKAALRPTIEKHHFDIRVFDPKEAVIKDLTITNFDSLDNCPEIILFEGSFNRDTGWIDIKKTVNLAA